MSSLDLPDLSLFPTKKSKSYLISSFSTDLLTISEQQSLIPLDKKKWRKPKSSTKKKGRKNRMQDLKENWFEWSSLKTFSSNIYLKLSKTASLDGPWFINALSIPSSPRQIPGSWTKMRDIRPSVEILIEKLNSCLKMSSSAALFLLCWVSGGGEQQIGGW